MFSNSDKDWKDLGRIVGKVFADFIGFKVASSEYVYGKTILFD